MDTGALETVSKETDAPLLTVRVENMKIGLATTWFPSNEALSAVRADFNPSSLSAVASLKTLCAAAIDQARLAGEQSGDHRSAAIAITKFEEACMWAVKAATAKV